MELWSQESLGNTGTLQTSKDGRLLIRAVAEEAPEAGERGVVSCLLGMNYCKGLCLFVLQREQFGLSTGIGSLMYKELGDCVWRGVLVSEK